MKTDMLVELLRETALVLYRNSPGEGGGGGGGGGLFKHTKGCICVLL